MGQQGRWSQPPPPLHPTRLIIREMAPWSGKGCAWAPARAVSELLGLSLLPTRGWKKWNMEEHPEIRDWGFGAGASILIRSPTQIL